MVRGAARGDDDASDSATAGAAARADNIPVDTAATGQASERDWVVFQARTAGRCAPSCPPLNGDPRSSCSRPSC